MHRHLRCKHERGEDTRLSRGSPLCKSCNRLPCCKPHASWCRGCAAAAAAGIRSSIVPNMSSKHCWHSANLPGFPHNQTRMCAIHARCLATCRHSAHYGLHQHPDANVCVYLSRRTHASKCGIAWTPGSDTSPHQRWALVPV